MDKIIEMMKELQVICNEEGYVMISYVDDGKKGVTLCQGTPVEIAFAVNGLVKEFDKRGVPVKAIDKFLSIKECNCPNCSGKRAAEQEREGASADKDEVFSMLAKLMKGEA